MRLSEQGVYGIFEAVHPSSSVDNWPLILANISVECVAQIYFGEDVEIRTVIDKLASYTGINKIIKIYITVVKKVMHLKTS